MKITQNKNGIIHMTATSKKDSKALENFLRLIAGEDEKEEPKLKNQNDENSQAFKDSLESYRAIIDEKGDEEDLLKHCAYTVCKFGDEQMIEGVGYATINGKTKMNYGNGTREEDCGIEITGDFDINGTPDIYIDLEEI